MRHPPKPPMEQGVLLPKIVAHERLQLPCFTTELCLSDLPCHAQPPYRLHSVRACGQTSVQPGCTPSTVVLHIPVQVHAYDACGKCFTASAFIDVEARAPYAMNQCRHHMLWASPEVRLLECTQGDGCFPVRLSVWADVYLLRLEPSMHRPQCPSCPQLPLYPPPIH